MIVYWCRVLNIISLTDKATVAKKIFVLEDFAECTNKCSCPVHTQYELYPNLQDRKWHTCVHLTSLSSISNDPFCDSLQACSLLWMGRMFSLQTCIISKLLSTSFLLILNPYMAWSYVHAYCVDTAGRYSRKPANPLQSMRPFAMYLHAARCIDLETWTA